MDYTKLPRKLIYKDRKDIDDFPVNSKVNYQFLEESFLKLLERRPFIKESYDAPELILQIFNNARYITTLICLEKHPNHYLHKYLEIAGSNDRSITIANHAMPATMALVINYLCHYMPTLYDGSQIVEDITDNFNTVAWKEMTHGGQEDFKKLVIDKTYCPPGWLSDPDFAPRDIREVVDDPLITVRDISENIDYILDSLQKCVSIFDEEIAPLNAMYKKMEAWFSTDLDDNMNKELALGKIDTRLKKLDPNNAYDFFNLMNEMEKSLHEGQDVPPATKDEIKKYVKKTLGVDIDELESAYQSMQADSENDQEDYLKLKPWEEVRIDQLEDENAKLRDEIKQIKDYIKGAVTYDKVNEVLNIKEFGIGVGNAKKIVADAITRAENGDSPIQQSNLNIEVQNQIIQEQKKEIDRLNTMNEVIDKQLKRYQDEEASTEDLNEEQKLEIDERIIFVSALLGVSLKPDVVNQTQLAKLIEKLTGDTWQSIRPRISSINSETQQVNDKTKDKFSEGTQTAAKNVYELINKAVKGATRENKGYQCKQAMENINQTYQLGIKM